MNHLPSIQLFCFPHAGASAATYVRWRRLLPPWIDVQPVELSGHGRRIAEPLETTMAGVLAHVSRVVRRDPSLPFALFGHSLGALVAFEYARKLQREGAPAPLLVFASGSHAPSQRERARLLDSDVELHEELVRLAGTPSGVLADPDLMKLALPVLRADFQVSAGYRCAADASIGAPLHVLFGRQDDVEHDSLRTWARHTRAGFAIDSFEGGHFFIDERRAEVLALLELALARTLGSGARAHTQIGSSLSRAGAAQLTLRGGSYGNAAEH